MVARICTVPDAWAVNVTWFPLAFCEIVQFTPDTRDQTIVLFVASDGTTVALNVVACPMTSCARSGLNVMLVTGLNADMVKFPFLLSVVYLVKNHNRFVQLIPSGLVYIMP
jgi:hypothetical protein